jgi:hypothetical protein
MLLILVLTYIGVSAVSHGLSPGFSFYLVAIANASSVLGRCGCGLISDRTGLFPDHSRYDHPRLYDGRTLECYDPGYDYDSNHHFPMAYGK